MLSKGAHANMITPLTPLLSPPKGQLHPTPSWRLTSPSSWEADKHLSISVLSYKMVVLAQASVVLLVKHHPMHGELVV